MKLLLIFLLSNQLSAKDIIEYECLVQPDLKFELSFADSKNPTISIEKKKIKIARCFYQTLPTSRTNSKKSVSTNSVWNLHLTKCESYTDKLKKLYKYSDMASFIQVKGKASSYLRIFKDQQPMACKPKLKK